MGWGIVSVTPSPKKIVFRRCRDGHENVERAVQLGGPGGVDPLVGSVVVPGGRGVLSFVGAVMSKARLVVCYDCKVEKPRKVFMPRDRAWKKAFPEYKAAEERLAIEHPGENAKARDARYVGICFECFCKRSWAEHEDTLVEWRPRRVSMVAVVLVVFHHVLHPRLLARDGAGR